MGITNLLITLKNKITIRNISYFENKRIAIDTYSWIHKSLYGSINKLLEDSNSESWIIYCLNLIDMLLFYSIEVILIFDGKELPAKFKTEKIREKNRLKNYEEGMKLKEKGDEIGGRSLLARSIDVTPKMAAKLIKICRKYRPTVKCIVAPYEADAQLAFLSRNNLVDLVISEDSDCIPYQCKEVIILILLFY